MSSSPPSTSSSSLSTPSPTIDPQQLKNDADTFDFLMQSLVGDSDSSSSHANSPPDWSDFSSWTHTDAKYPDLTTDFDFSLPMELEFDPNMAVDPSALHFTNIFDQPMLNIPVDTSFAMPQDMSNSMLFPPDVWAAHLQPQTGRRLSITSSSSSSGASLSPIVEHASVAASPIGEGATIDPAADLAHRVRQMAGVTLAVPVSAQVQQMAAAGGQNKLPIPRLPRPAAAPTSFKTSPKASPAPDAPLSSASSDAGPSAPGAATGVIGRPKTSHTTIERRYRTNLNARITGLKQAVPALRVLEAKTGSLGHFDDIVDERGFVDGVKVARKMSKANVLGKATEYIRVLKKREARLKREQDGLKSLISGLVGGPALLKEWEREWRERFGGEEKDEIEDDPAMGGSDEEDEDSDGEDEEGRARKKAKVVKPKKEKPYKPPQASAPAIPLAPGAVPEKRKRGRPRKNPLPPGLPVPIPASASPSPLAAQGSAVPPIIPTDDAILQQQYAQMQQSAQAQQPAQQYLLAVFAFFSVFNSPFASRYSSDSPTHEHHGTVLTPHSPTATATAVVPLTSTYGLHEVVQAVHLLVSTLVLFYVIIPWLSGAFKSAGPRLASLFSKRIPSCPAPSAAPTSKVVESEAPLPTMKPKTRAVLMDALSPRIRGSADEAATLRAALGISTGLLGLLQGVYKATRADRGIELNQLEQRAWVRLGELVAFDARAGRTTRVQTYACMAWHISKFAASTTDLSTLALIIRPLAPARATKLWERARAKAHLRAEEKLVLENMSVEAAAGWLERWQTWHETERKTRCAACEKRTPLGVLAAILIREQLRKHAAALFVRTVVRPQDQDDGECDEYVYDAERDWKEEQERRDTIAAGRSIGGRTAELAGLLERIWETGFCAQDDIPAASSPGHAHSHAPDDEDADCEDEQDLASSDEAEIRALLRATIIYRRLFPSSFPACATSVAFVLSPPPSPSRKNVELHVALRAALGSPAFEYAGQGRAEGERLGAALEDARDRVVDMLVNLERAGRRGRA